MAATISGSICLKVLIDRALAHFRREEMIMKKNGYPDLEVHRTQHREIMVQLNALYTAYQRAPTSEVSTEIIEMLASWLMEHVLETDMLYRPYIQDATS